jgi:carbonic anhydrase
MSDQQHGCKAIALFCIDYRLHLTALARLMESIGYSEGSYDHVCIAGSGMDFLSTVLNESEHMFKQIAIAVEKHGISEVVILQHDACGAYGISDPAAEDAKQKADLARIVELIGIKFPSLTVKTYIIKGTAEGELTPELVTV